MRMSQHTAPHQEQRISYRKTAILGLALACLTGVFPSTARAAGDHGSSCTTASALRAGEQITGFHDGTADRDVFQIETSAPGILALVVEGPGGREPRLQFLGRDCLGSRPQDVRFAARTDTHHLLEIRTPGEYFVRVLAGPGLDGEMYRLASSFRPLAALEPEELILDAEPPGTCGAGAPRLFGPADAMPSAVDRFVVTSDAIDEVDDDVLELTFKDPTLVHLVGSGPLGASASLYAGTRCDSRSQIASEIPLDRLGSRLLRLDPGTYSLRVSQALATAGVYRLKIRTLALEGMLRGM